METVRVAKFLPSLLHDNPSSSVDISEISFPGILSHGRCPVNRDNYFLLTSFAFLCFFRPSSVRQKNGVREKWLRMGEKSFYKNCWDPRVLIGYVSLLIRGHEDWYKWLSCADLEIFFKLLSYYHDCFELSVPRSRQPGTQCARSQILFWTSANKTFSIEGHNAIFLLL